MPAKNAARLKPLEVSAERETHAQFAAKRWGGRAAGAADALLGIEDGVSLAEYQAWMRYAFDQMDRNGDGVLTPEELPGGKGRPITLAEHMAKLAAAFNRQDTNRDGFLDTRELAAPPQR